MVGVDFSGSGGGGGLPGQMFPKSRPAGPLLKYCCAGAHLGSFWAARGGGTSRGPFFDTSHAFLMSGGKLEQKCAFGVGGVRKNGI